ncbi:MAG: type II secretion system F family protein [Chloroflexi bacterium]|nr:type II secretion system F family protein [Chloroflexota bacterium]
MLALFAMAGTALVLFGLSLMVTQPAMKNRLEEFATRPRSLDELELEKPFSERVLKPIVDRISKVLSGRTPENTMKEIQRKLVLSGNPKNWTPQYFLGLKGVAAIVMLFVGFYFGAAVASFPMNIAIGFGMGFLGYYLPDIYLSSLTGRRKKEITKALPDALDLLTISVEAGLGFDSALGKVSQKWDNSLSREFGRVLTDMRLGKPRRDALKDLSARTEVDDVSTFVSALIQADALGVSIAKILTLQSEQMRLRRRQRAEEEAHKAPIKMMLPMVFMIFPSIFLIILGPIAPLMIGP